MYEFVITTRTTTKAQFGEREIEERSTLAHEYKFSLHDYNDAIKKFNEICDWERKFLLAEQRTAPSFILNSGVSVTFAIYERDEDEEFAKPTELELLNSFEYSFDDIKREIAERTEQQEQEEAKYLK